MSMHWIDWFVIVVVTGFMTVMAWGTKKYTRSVADFMAANRCAGKYLLGIADGMAGIGAISIIAYFQQFYEAGFTAVWWGLMVLPVHLIIRLSGWVVYRYRQTRAMTLAQFFEIRYSKNFRIFTGLLAFLAGIVNFGIFPAVGARFFIYFCGFPNTMVVYALTMGVLISIALLFTFMGGQIAVIVTDFFQGLFVNIMYIVLFAILFFTFDWSQITQAMAMVPEGRSMVHPFKIGRLENFNIWFFIISLAITVYNYKAWQGSQGYNASAKTPHDAKMANILGMLREFSQSLFLLFLPICAYTLMTHPDFATQADSVNAVLAGIGNEEIQAQVKVPLAIRQVIPIGLAGAFAAVVLAAFISTHDTYLHSWGSIFIQDVILPFRKTPLTPKQHMTSLRWSIIGVAIFIFVFALFFKQTERIFIYFMITGAIYLGGVGVVMIGGLYWKRGTTTAAWSAMIVGSTLATLSVVIPLFDKDLLPLDGKWMTAISMTSAVVVYILVSLLGERTVFDLDRMLHRGKYAKEGEHQVVHAGAWWKVMGMGKEFTAADRVIYLATLINSVVLFSTFVIGMAINLTYEVSDESWATFWRAYLIVYFVFGFSFTVWFSIGGLLDMKSMFAMLRSVRRDARDDGTVVDHHNLDECNGRV